MKQTPHTVTTNLGSMVTAPSCPLRCLVLRVVLSTTSFYVRRLHAQLQGLARRLDPTHGLSSSRAPPTAPPTAQMETSATRDDDAVGFTPRTAHFAPTPRGGLFFAASLPPPLPDALSSCAPAATLFTASLGDAHAPRPSHAEAGSTTETRSIGQHGQLAMEPSRATDMQSGTDRNAADAASLAPSSVVGSEGAQQAARARVEGDRSHLSGGGVLDILGAPSAAPPTPEALPSLAACVAQHQGPTAIGESEPPPPSCSQTTALPNATVRVLPSCALSPVLVNSCGDRAEAPGSHGAPAVAEAWSSRNDPADAEVAASHGNLKGVEQLKQGIGKLSAQKFFEVQGSLEGETPMSVLQVWLALMDKQLQSTLEEGRALKQKQAELAHEENEKKGNPTLLAQQLAERTNLQRRINETRSRREEIVSVVRAGLAYHFVSMLQLRAKHDTLRKHDTLQSAMQVALSKWRAAVFGAPAIHTSHAVRDELASPQTPSPQPRWMKKAISRGRTVELNTPEALLNEMGHGGTRLYQVKWHGYATPTWELASEIEAMDAFPALRAKMSSK